MSRDSHPNNLRLMGSPVNLSYRSKKKDDKKNPRNRPRSALQNSGFIPESQERLRRPFSADANKEHVPSTRTFLKTFSAELLQSYNNSPNNITVLPPTTDLLEDKVYQVKTENRDREVCSNASDHGSEDTFTSLGTKIKARAQSPKAKNSNTKNFIKYRNIAKKGRKLMDNNINTSEPKADSSPYGLEIKITDKRENSPVRNKNLFEQRSFSPMFKQPSYDSYFLSLDQEKKVDEDSLVGRVSFGNGALHSEVELAIDTYNRRLTLTKHQLSLVEEESTQDVESVPSHNLSSLSPEHSLEEPGNSKIDTKGEDSGQNSYGFDPKDTKARDISGPRTYRSFYDDFQTGSTQQYKMSSTLVNTDASSKDSGYTDSGHNDEKPDRRSYSLPCKASLFKKSMTKVTKEQPKSLECIPLRPASAESFRSVANNKSQRTEPLNHSRLLYKDFFLKKEGHIATAPQNSPRKSDINDTENKPGSSESIRAKTTNEEKTLEYPSYLLNSGTKAYTSKVIEDYKKEIEAINNLHELTLKDLKTDSISPTPLNIDKLFEQHSILFDDNSEQSQESVQFNTVPEASTSNGDTSLHPNNNKKDISEISTQELIVNYMKVKDEDYNNVNFTKNLKKLETKISNITNGECSLASNQFLNNKNYPKSILTKTLPVHIKNQTHKSMLSMKTPLSARIDSVQNDKDIESWMSLSAPSPRVLENNNCVSASNIKITEPFDTMPNTAKIVTNTEKDIESPPVDSTATENVPQSKELESNATVLDIYSMLKEIESFGEKPVAVPNEDTNEDTQSARTNEPRPATPKDNFLEIFQFLENVEQSANDALSAVTTTTPQNIPKLEVLLKLPQTELAQRLVTLSLQLEERSCCIALLQESLANHKEQMVNKVSNLEKQSMRSVARVKQECEDAVKRHQAFIDQLISDKKTLNHRIEQLVDERRALEERWRRSAHALEERYKLQLSNQRDKMAAAQQVARQRWVRQKAEKIKELTVKGLEGELREMAERQQSEIADIKMAHAETIGRLQSRHAADLDQLRTSLEQDRDAAVLKERQVASARMEKQILELELSYQEQRTRLVAEMRAENERVASGLSERERCQRREIEKWREDQERILNEKKAQVDQRIAEEQEKLEEDMKRQREELEAEFEKYKKEFEVTQRLTLKQRESEIAAQYRRERDREIERAIESMDSEAQAGRKELQEALRRNKEQYELELKALAETEQATLRRYQDAQARVRQTEDKCAELEVSINQLQTRNRILTEKTLDLDQRSDEIRSSCEAAWIGKVEALRKDLEEQKRVHEEQMHQLYAKVKVAVARKDSAIQALTRESAKHQEKAALLEQKLQQQRKDFFKK